MMLEIEVDHQRYHAARALSCLVRYPRNKTRSKCMIVQCIQSKYHIARKPPNLRFRRVSGASRRLDRATPILKVRGLVVDRRSFELDSDQGHLRQRQVTPRTRSKPSKYI